MVYLLPSLGPVVALLLAAGAALATEASPPVSDLIHVPWWVFVLVVVLLFGLAHHAQTWRVRRLRQQRAHFEWLVHERTRQLEDTNAMLAVANQRLQAQSRTDPLTQLWNRRYLADRIEQDLAQVLRLREQGDVPDLSMVFLLIDIDRFKQVNDIYGHGTGDEVLVETARRLKAIARASDYVIRWGGEEFLLVACFSPLGEAPQIAARVMDGLWNEPFSVTGEPPITVTGSTGFSVFPFELGRSTVVPDARAWQHVVSLADTALYRAKEHGRRQWAGLLPGQVPWTMEVTLGCVARNPALHLQHGDIKLVMPA